MADLFWLSDEQWAVIEPFMPRDQPGPERKDDRQIISGILHVLTSGCRWRDCPAAYGPRTTVYNRFNRWSRRGFWKAMLSALAEAGWAGNVGTLDSSFARAHRSVHGGKGSEGAGHRLVARRPDDRDPRSQRCPRPAQRPPADAGQRQRRHNRPSIAGRGAGPDPPPERRQGLRRRLAGHRSAQERHHARPSPPWSRAMSRRPDLRKTEMRDTEAIR